MKYGQLGQPKVSSLFSEFHLDMFFNPKMLVSIH